MERVGGCGFVCVGVFPSETTVCLCLGPVETEYVCDCVCEHIFMSVL